MQRNKQDKDRGMLQINVTEKSLRPSRLPSAVRKSEQNRGDSQATTPHYVLSSRRRDHRKILPSNRWFQRRSRGCRRHHPCRQSQHSSIWGPSWLTHLKENYQTWHITSWIGNQNLLLPRTNPIRRRPPLIRRFWLRFPGEMLLRLILQYPEMNDEVGNSQTVGILSLKTSSEGQSDLMEANDSRVGQLRFGLPEEACAMPSMGRLTQSLW